MLVIVLAISLFCTSINAEVQGVYYWTWSTGKVNVTNTNLDVAFSGDVDPDQAISDSASVYPKLTGDKYISIGGGDNDGKWTSSWVRKVSEYCSSGKFSGYVGVVLDIEIGDSGLASDFADAFSACKSQNYKVLVTVSNSAPYAIDDAATLMRSFFPNKNIDYLSPQLYSSGNEKSNDYSTNAGVQYTEWAKAVAQVIPSIVTSSLYSDAKSVFHSRFGIQTAGHVRRSQKG